MLRSSRTSNRGETSQNISVEIDPDGFVSREKQKHADEPLLFAVFQQQTAYLIDIMKHGDRARDHVLEGLVAEWPDEGIIHVVSQSGTKGSARRVTEGERANLRGNHYNAGVFMPAGGMMAGGTTSAARQGAQQVLRKIADFEQALTANPRCLTPDFERHGLAFPETPEFELIVSSLDLNPRLQTGEALAVFCS